MIGREEGTSTLWDRWFVERLFPPDHLLMRIDRAVDFGFVEEEVRDLYAPETGRPAYPPEKLLRVLLVAYLYGLSDVRVAEEIRYNLAFRAFCRFPLEAATPDDTTLVVFRRRLGPERFQRLFDRIVAQAREKGIFGVTPEAGGRHGDAGRRGAPQPRGAPAPRPAPAPAGASPRTAGEGGGNRRLPGSLRS